MQPITDREGFEHLTTLPACLFLKHGARCPISANARDEVTRFVAMYPRVPAYSLEVTENRELAREIAASLGVHHESPQLFLLQLGRAAWHVEHYDINSYDIGRRLAEK